MSSIMVTIGNFAADGAEYYQRYAEGVLPLLGKTGTTVRERLKGSEALVGEDFPELVAVLEFKDKATTKAFLSSPEYQALVPYRERAFKSIRTFACETW